MPHANRSRRNANHRRRLVAALKQRQGPGRKLTQGLIERHSYFRFALALEQDSFAERIRAFNLVK